MYSDCGAPAFCSQGRCIEGTRTCPKLDPTFSSINANFLQVGCGVRLTNCHAADSPSVNSGPSFAGHPFLTLVDAPAANRLGSARGLVLVKPGDPANSFLLAKLRLTSALDPAYGGGQPASSAAIASRTLSPVTLGNNGAAQKHAQDMADNYFLSHWGTDGLKPYMRYTLEGGLNYDSENSAYSGPQQKLANPGSIYARLDPKSEIESLEYSMLNDDASSNWGHRDNILNPLHKKVNLGLAYDLYHLAFVEEKKKAMGLVA